MTQRTKPLRGGPKATPVHPSVTPRPGLSLLFDSPRLPLPAPCSHRPTSCPAVLPDHGGGGRTSRPRVPSRRELAMTPLRRRMTEDLILHNSVPQDDPALHQVGRRFRPALPHLARTTRARARPLLPAPPGPGATGLLERPQAGPPRPPVPLPRHPGQGRGSSPRSPAPRRPRSSRSSSARTRWPGSSTPCKTPSTARCS